MNTINKYVEMINNLEVNYENLPKEIKDNKQVALAAVKRNPFNYELISEELKNDKSFALDCIGAQWDMISYLNPLFRSDKDVVMLSIKDDPTTFMFASDNLKKDREVALFAASCGADMIALKDYNDDKEIALESLKHRSSNLLNLSEELRDDLEVVLAAVEQETGNILYASQRIRKMVQITAPKDYVFTLQKELVRLEVEKLESELNDCAPTNKKRIKL